jgi:hypothetical protein
MCEITAVLEAINGNTITDAQQKQLWHAVATRMSDMRDHIKNCATKDDVAGIVSDLRETASKAAKYDLIVSVAKSKATYVIAAFGVALAFGIRAVANIMPAAGG